MDFMASAVSYTHLDVYKRQVRDIREAHLKDKTTADPQPTLDDVKKKFEQAIGQGSDTEMLILSLIHISENSRTTTKRTLFF